MTSENGGEDTMKDKCTFGKTLCVKNKQIEYCCSRKDDWYCTRERYHEGNHIACGSFEGELFSEGNHNIAIW